MSRRKRRTPMAFEKARDVRLTKRFLDSRTAWAKERGYDKAKWVIFCETLLDAGYHLSLYEARETLSKYITVSDGNSSYKVRFSNHRPNKTRELRGDCDFFVGVTHTGYRNTGDALEAVSKHFGADIRGPA